VVLRDVPPNSTVVGVPAHIVYRDGKRVVITDPRDIKDPLSDALLTLSKEVAELRSRLTSVEDSARSQAAARDSVAGLAKEDEERREYRSEFDKK
jgi:serine O-acetyltransferase